jgi:hypothetical protein
MDYTLSTQLLLGMIPYQGSFKKLEEDGFKNAYLAFDDPNKIGDFFYFVFSEIPDERLRELVNLDAYEDHFEIEEDTIFKFSLTEEQQTDIVQPFLKGKYSLIDRDFVKKHHPKLVYTGKGTYIINQAHLIMHKSNSLRKYWEDRIGVKLPPDAEVWSKVKSKDETYILNSQSISNE